ncbi:MAG: BrnT family toxin [Deltaproteobacteria bacterium]|nr:BrnT family toxin [Deltaproteobacteria bacterium]
MLFSWDSNKAQQNVKKHGVSFELAQTVFDDPLHLSILDFKSKIEERWVTIGMSAHVRTLVVVHAYRVTKNEEEIIRIISARKATRREVRQYEEGI